jgi:hypothetical protein
VQSFVDEYQKTEITSSFRQGSIQTKEKTPTSLLGLFLGITGLGYQAGLGLTKVHLAPALMNNANFPVIDFFVTPENQYCRHAHCYNHKTPQVHR